MYSLFNTTQFKIIISTSNCIQNVIDNDHTQMLTFDLHWCNLYPLVNLRIVPAKSCDCHVTMHHCTYFSTVFSGDIPFDPPTAYKQPSTTPIATPSR